MEFDKKQVAKDAIISGTITQEMVNFATKLVDAFNNPSFTPEELDELIKLSDDPDHQYDVNELWQVFIHIVGKKDEDILNEQAGLIVESDRISEQYEKNPIEFIKSLRHQANYRSNIRRQFGPIATKLAYEEYRRCIFMSDFPREEASFNDGFVKGYLKAKTEENG